MGITVIAVQKELNVFPCTAAVNAFFCKSNNDNNDDDDDSRLPCARKIHAYYGRCAGKNECVSMRRDNPLVLLSVVFIPRLSLRTSIIGQDSSFTR